jgi:hypothetical protein
MNSKETGCESVDWIHLAQDRLQWRALVNMVMNLRVPQKAWNFLTSWATVRFSTRTLLHVNSQSLFSTSPSFISLRLESFSPQCDEPQHCTWSRVRSSTRNSAEFHQPVRKKLSLFESVLLLLHHEHSAKYYRYCECGQSSKPKFPCSGINVEFRNRLHYWQ